jgi:hypothetical protein
MKRAIWATVVFWPALVVLAFAQMLSAGTTKGRVSHTIVVKSGDAAPPGGNYLIFSFLNATLNGRHAVAFDAVSGPPFTTGIFVGNGKRTSTIALGTNPDPDGQSFGTVMNPFTTNDGDVVFDGDSQILKSNGKKIIPLVQLGDTVPGRGMVGSVTGRVTNDQGAVAYLASMSGATATQAVLRSNGVRTIAIASDDIAPPTGGSFTSLESPDMNDHGQVAFKSDMTGGSAEHGIFRGEGGRLTPVFVTNQVVPGGASVDECGGAAINTYGQVAAICSLKNGATNAGLFIGDGKATFAIALDGQPAPKGGNYSILESLKLNDRGEVAFLARLTDSTSGLFRGNGKHTTTIALSGTSAPGTTGVFQSFGDVFELGNDGRVALVAQLESGVGGVDSSNDLGIWVGTSEEDLQLVVRTGDVIDGNVVTGLPFLDIGGHPLDMNENEVLWRGNFGAVKALVVSRISCDREGEGD